MSSSYSRLVSLTLSGILPFNFGMDYNYWLNFYNEHPDYKDLCGSDPKTWSKEDIDFVNKRAAEEIELYDYMMGLSDEDFRNEINKRSIHEEAETESNT
jgi:hypothetical protein